MLGAKILRLIERHSEEITDNLFAELRASEHTKSYRNVDFSEFRASTVSLYAHLEEWLLSKDPHDIERYFTTLGARRAAAGVPASELACALMMSKAQLWTFVYRECAAEKALELFVEIEFLVALDRFYDRAIYFALVGHEHGAHASKAA
jgi:hypothetical protein